MALSRWLHLSGPQFPHPLLAVPDTAPSDLDGRSSHRQMSAATAEGCPGWGRASGPAGLLSYCEAGYFMPQRASTSLSVKFP